MRNLLTRRWIWITGLVLALTSGTVGGALAYADARTEPTLAQVQRGLVGMYFNISVDGAWGNETDGALRAFQKACGYTETVKKGNKALYKRVTGLVAEIQTAVGAKIDGDYGTRTRTKVKIYQDKVIHDPNPDGTAGTQTRAWLSNDTKLAHRISNPCLGTLPLAQALNGQQPDATYGGSKSPAKVSKEQYKRAGTPPTCVTFSKAQSGLKPITFDKRKYTIQVDYLAVSGPGGSLFRGYYCYQRVTDPANPNAELYVVAYWDVGVRWIASTNCAKAYVHLDYYAYGVRDRTFGRYQPGVAYERCSNSKRVAGHDTAWLDEPDGELYVGRGFQFIVAKD